MKTLMFLACLAAQAPAAVHISPINGFSTLAGWPKASLTENNRSTQGKIALTPLHKTWVASVQFTHTIDGDFGIDFRYNTCDSPNLFDLHGDGVAVILGKPISSYLLASDLPKGNALGVINDGHGFAVLFKTVDHTVQLVDGHGTPLASIRDYPVYTRCAEVPASIDLRTTDEGRRLLTVRVSAPRRGAAISLHHHGIASSSHTDENIVFTHVLTEYEYQNLIGRPIAFGAATGTADSSHTVLIESTSGLDLL